MSLSARVKLVLTLSLLLPVVRLAVAERRPTPPATSNSSDASRSWPFNTPVRPTVPKIDDPWIANSVDAFILDRLQQQKLNHSAEADRRTLLRRVTVDLTGMLPTIAEQNAFLADTSPGAYERVVDQLLASSRFGERMTQHWLDLVRYADSDGFNEDRYRPGAYPYRDYCIRAFNDDLPYDHFLRQQLAGDELEPDNVDAQIATGLLRLGPEETNAVLLRHRRQEIIDDSVAIVGQAFMGLTIGCAKCHDHKYDDIPQSDYYRLAAFFQPMLQSQRVIASPAEQTAFDEKQAAWEAATREIRAEMATIIAPFLNERTSEARAILGPEFCAVLDKPVVDRTSADRQLAFQADIYLEWKTRETSLEPTGEAGQRYRELAARLATFDAMKPEPLAVADTVVDAGRESPTTYCLAGGMIERPLDALQPGILRLVDDATLAITPSSQSTGRRAALARWLTDARHPLTARVIANRIWQQHFGRGLVTTSSDFGTMGSPPSHRELLDWLAVELIDHGWSLKHLHRMIVTSATYRQSSHDSNSAASATDPDNALLSHAPRRRLDGEVVRDAMLQLSGQLNSRMYGPPARPELPSQMGIGGWEPDERVEDRNRRSIYVFVKRNTRFPLFEAFDAPSREESCSRREETTTPSQALVMLNSPFSLECAQRWSERLREQLGSSRVVDVAQLAYVEAFGRVPTDEELQGAEKFVQQMERMHSKSPIVDFCHALLNSNEFLYVD